VDFKSEPGNDSSGNIDMEPVAESPIPMKTIRLREEENIEDNLVINLKPICSEVESKDDTEGENRRGEIGREGEIERVPENSKSHVVQPARSSLQQDIIFAVKEMQLDQTRSGEKTEDEFCKIPSMPSQGKLVEETESLANAEKISIHEKKKLGDDVSMDEFRKAVQPPREYDWIADGRSEAIYVFCAIQTRVPEPMKLQEYRLATFSSGRRFPVTAVSLSRAGFVCYAHIHPGPENEKSVLCGWCGLILGGLQKGMLPLALHRTYSSRCSFLIRNSEFNIELSHNAIMFPVIADDSTVVRHSEAHNEDSSDANHLKSYERIYSHFKHPK